MMNVPSKYWAVSCDCHSLHPAPSGIEPSNVQSMTGQQLLPCVADDGRL
jgi:hypothetical protein